MSIAEKLTTVAENQQRVYDAGFTAGQEAGSGAGSYDDGFEAGKQAEYDSFWDSFQRNNTLTNYDYAFCSERWSATNFKPKYDMMPKSANMMFRDCLAAVDLQATLEELGVTLDFSKCSNFNYTFYISKFTRIGVVDTTSCTASDLTLTFASCANLRTIDKLILLEDGTSRINASTFQSSAQLSNITFEGTIGNAISFQWQAKLTDASVQSIIDHLKDLTGQTAKTLTLHADVKAKLTEEQLATITGKNWSVA